MSILKKRISLLLAFMMLALSIFPLMIVTASSNTNDVSMSVKLNGQTELQNHSEYDVNNGDKIYVSAKSNNGSSIYKIGYYYYDEGSDSKVVVYSDSLTITLPTEQAGTKRVLLIEAVAANNTGTNDPTNRTGWQMYHLNWKDDTAVEVNAKYNGNTLADKSTTTVNPGDKLTISGTPSNKVKALYYFWDNDKTGTKVESPSTTISIPSSFAPGSTHYLYLIARDTDGNDTPQKAYKFVIPDNSTSDPIDVNVKFGNSTLADKSTTKLAKPGDKLTIAGTPASRVKTLYYVWDVASPLSNYSGASTTITIPSDFKAGSTHYLYVIARDVDGNDTPQKSYKFVFPSESQPTNPDDDDLDILPWEKENPELNALSISLRNDSESDKDNKNIYALDEEVTYFVDFKNGGKDISDVVTIKLELPLKFEVIDADNGVVDSSKGTITWTYPAGMEEDYEGTKTVKVKYTAFDRKGVEYKTIYPLATISKAGKVADSSAVINLIYVDSDTTLDLYHIQYMYGDKYATTFRPDDTITRAEGALVLTRILLGQSAIDNVKVTSVYPDLDQTYLEAQKAIIAATSYGIINGYTDGYYRPNQTMTRAEFMKIIAKFIEINAEDEGVKGLNIKEIDNSVKLYRDPVIRYAVNGTTVSTHWAVEEVTLLNRLNMTDVSTNKNLRLDEGISRAEVAQLVNFYTFRAPAKVTSRVTTQFSDVSRNHKLFADIVEATRPSHDARFNDDGTEHVK